MIVAASYTDKKTNYTSEFLENRKEIFLIGTTYLMMYLFQLLNHTLVLMVSKGLNIARKISRLRLILHSVFNPAVYCI